MLLPTDPVSALPKIGPKYKNLLERLEIYTLGDLLYHFPFRYDDFTDVKKVSELKEGDVATVEGILGDIQNIFTRNGKRITKAKLVDETGTVEITWFNSHYLKKSLLPNKQYTISGKVGKFGNKLTFMAPTYEVAGDNNLNTSRLVPVYPETSGVSSKWIRGKIDYLLSQKPYLEEFLPIQILRNENYPNILEGLKKMHFPESMEDANIAKKRFQFEELFIELINVESRKKAWEQTLNAPPMNSLIYESEINNFIESLPFKLTASQAESVDEIILDLKKEHPMNRLLEGDVGTGKTIVAIVACYVAYLNGYNSLYMAPTEILAKQHYETFKKFLDPLGVNLQLQTGSKKLNLDEDKTITIGTHALLFMEEYERIGLVVIDEQHRFGVEQRTKLANMNKDKLAPHLLTMTATPIPRTLALTLYGDLEISVLKAPPNKEKKITTKVVTEKERDKAFEWIKKKGEQTFIVCPFIDESTHENFENVKAATAEYEKLKKGIFKNVPIDLLHGKMNSKEKQEVVDKFQRGETKVLVSTPVIEVGIDIPEATIIVIESAERYGLASLHQLRGRVGRGNKPGFCFVFMSGFNKNAYSRLKKLESVENGLELAEIDMGLRGHGDIYGVMQHGFKSFKIARLSDVNMLEKAKKYAQSVFKDINKYPKLKEQIAVRMGRFVGNN